MLGGELSPPADLLQRTGLDLISHIPWEPALLGAITFDQDGPFFTHAPFLLPHFHRLPRVNNFLFFIIYAHII